MQKVGRHMHKFTQANRIHEWDHNVCIYARPCVNLWLDSRHENKKVRKVFANTSSAVSSIEAPTESVVTAGAGRCCVKGAGSAVVAYAPKQRWVCELRQDLIIACSTNTLSFTCNWDRFVALYPEESKLVSMTIAMLAPHTRKHSLTSEPPHSHPLGP